MDTTNGQAMGEARLRLQLKQAGLGDLGDERTFERQDSHLLLLLSYGHAGAHAARFLDMQLDRTLYPGVNIATVEAPRGTGGRSATYRLRLATGGRVAFDAAVTIDQLRQYVTAWWRGQRSFEGAV